MENIIIGIIACVFIISFFAMLSFKRWIEYKEYELSLEKPTQKQKSVQRQDDQILWKSTYTIPKK